MNDKFLIVKNMKEFIMSLDSIVINLPRKDFYMRDRFYEDTYDILELMYKANYSVDEDTKKDIQLNILSKISMLDFYLEKCFKNKYISEKQCCNKSNQLLKITKMVYGWINHESKH